jgi:hypothetical protein
MNIYTTHWKIRVSSFRRRPESSVLNQLDTGFRRCNELVEVQIC